MTAAPPPAPRERVSWRRTVRAAFTERLGTKATALLISLLLWLIVSARQPTQSLVRVSILPVLDSSLVLLDQPEDVRALVAGRGADLLKLYAVPPVVRRVVNGDAPDTLVLDITPADVRISPDIANDVRVLDVQPRSVVLHFEPRATRRVAVVNDGRVLVRDGTVIGTAAELRFEPAMVRITGPRRQVRRLSAVHPFSLTIVRGDTLPHIADLDTTGLNVRVLPSQVKVTVRSAP